jgi:CRISPR-associated protein Cmr3
MTTWLIQPRDPLIFRDGKPFNATPGARAQSLPFPYPSTLAGGLRTRAGRDANDWFDPEQDIDRLRQMRICGPLLVALDDKDEIAAWYFPAPADCLFVKPTVDDEKQGQRYWVRPIMPPERAQTNLEPKLQLVSTNSIVKQKRHKAAPHFWNWEALQAWLLHPVNDQTPVALDSVGISGLTSESRVHVRIDGETGTAEEGFLFQTSSLEFQRLANDEKPKRLSAVQRYALAIEVEEDTEFDAGIDFLGGERRVVNWTQSKITFLSCPAEIREVIIAQKHCRLLLATPAIFKQGYLPHWICENTPGLTITIVAAAVSRYEGVSGWDAEKRTQKPSRRLSPAGSVYYLALEGSETAISRFIDSVWMHTISDTEQDRLDGFGLALLGTWDGTIQPLEVNV